MPAVPRFREGLYPHGGWTVNLPDGSVITAPSREALDKGVADALHCDLPAARDFVDERLCARYPSSCEGGKATRNIGLSLADRASMFLTSFEERAVSLKSPEVVEARLAICRVCPKNHGRTTPGCCGSPKTIEALASSVAAEHKIRGVFGAGWCGILGANLVIASHLCEPYIPESDAAHDHLPPSCPYRID